MLWASSPAELEEAGRAQGGKGSLALTDRERLFVRTGKKHISVTAGAEPGTRQMLNETG